MNILLIGGGGREHALAMALAQSAGCDKLWAAPGNPGIAALATLAAINPLDHGAVTGFCRANDIDLVVIGPEAPLVAGLADDLRAAGIAAFGPSAAAARLEGSKGFTKDLCARIGIPTAAFARTTTRAEADAAIERFGIPVVIKADGLAAGKGVTVAMSAPEAIAALDAIHADGPADAVVEAFLTGEEASLFALSDGDSVVAFGTAQDHKRVGDGDTGPNTGGMGAYSPADVMTQAMINEAMDRIVRPTVRAMADAGTPFTGVLFAGLMLTRDGPMLIEYNCRFGDPECQVLMARVKGDFAGLLHAAATGRLADAAAPSFTDDAALCMVMAAEGYPGSPRTGGRIDGIAAAEAAGATVFHAGTKVDDTGTLVAAGGRVLGVTATGPDIKAAHDRAYAAVAAIDFPTGFCRSDIGWRAVARAAHGQPRAEP